MKKNVQIILIVALLGINGVVGAMFYNIVKDKKSHEAATVQVQATSQPDSIQKPQQDADQQTKQKDNTVQTDNTADKAEPEPNSSAPVNQNDVKEVVISNETYKYTGESLNGKAHGQGIAYFSNGQKKYEGEFRNGKRIMVGKSYFENGKLAAEGTRSNGQIKIKSYNEDGSLYSEITRNETDKPGQATIYYEDGTLHYKGQVNADSGIPEGQGEEYNQNGQVQYVGSFKNGMYDGTGIFSYNNESYEGKFKDGDMVGGGKFYKDGVLTYDGEHDKGVPHGKGKYYLNGSLAYEGDFKNNTMDGMGKLYDNNGKLAYEGEFKENKATGNGTNYLDSATNIEIRISFDSPEWSNNGTFNVPDGIKVHR